MTCARSSGVGAHVMRIQSSGMTELSKAFMTAQLMEPLLPFFFFSPHPLCSGEKRLGQFSSALLQQAPNVNNCIGA